MGWNADTGMWEPDVYRQPLGAMGAVMALHNAQQAKTISDQLMQGRAQTLAEEQEKLGEEQQRFGWEQQARQAMQDLPDDATADQIARTYMRTGGNPAYGFPFLKSSNAIQGRKDIQTLKNYGQVYNTYLRQAGNDPAMARLMMKRMDNTLSDDDLDVVASLGQLPKAAADTANAQAGANLKNTEAANIPIKQEEVRRHDLATEGIHERMANKLRDPNAIMLPKERVAIERAQQDAEMRIANIDRITQDVDLATYKHKTLTPDQVEAKKQLKELVDSYQGMLDVDNQRRTASSSGLAPAAPGGFGQVGPGQDPTDPFNVFAKPH